MTERRSPSAVPGHVLVMLGASTAAYAITLAGMAGLQSRNEAVLAAARAPSIDGVSELASAHDGLADRLDAAAAAYARAVERFAVVGGSLEALDGRLAALGNLVAEIDGVSRSMPSSIRLPAVRSSVTTVRVPASHATTGASGN